MEMTRRSFAATAAACLGPNLRDAAAALPLAVQLYSLCGLAWTDPPVVLAHVAQLGYDGVEVAHYYGHSAADPVAILKNQRGRIVSLHVKDYSAARRALGGRVWRGH